MSTAKFEKLIDLIINEDQERAEQLFHEIVVEKSRQIYENLMSEEDLDEDMTTDLMQEIEHEEEGDDTTMEDDMEDEEISGDYDVEAGDGEDEAEMDMDDMDDADMGSEESATKDDIMDLEDKLDQLLAAFEAEFGEEEGEEGEEEEEEGEEEESGVMEAVEMKKVAVTHTDGTDKTSMKTPTAFNSGQAGMASRPVKFSDGGDTKSPTSPATPSNKYTQGHGQVPGAGSFKNAPGSKGGNTEAAPKPVTKQAAGVNVKDVVPESRKPTKKMVK